jgi:hypothetical protein
VAPDAAAFHPAVPRLLVVPAPAFTQVSAGDHHTCALRADATLACWGNNAVGQAAAPAGTFAQVEAGDNGTCALRTNATLVCWGTAFSGAPAGAFTQVTAGGSYGCALKSDGTLVCWGDNQYAQATPPTTRVLPTATFTAPAGAGYGGTFPVALTGAQVPGHPEATRFTYAFDCGAGYGAASSAASASCPGVAGRPADREGEGDRPGRRRRGVHGERGGDAGPAERGVHHDAAEPRAPGARPTRSRRPGARRGTRWSSAASRPPCAP